MSKETQLVLDFSSISSTSATRLASDGPCSKTCPDFSAAMEDEILLVWLEHWLGNNLVYRKMDGKTLEFALGRKGSSSGAFWMRNGSDWRSGGSVCSLSAILETGDVAPRYFLSAKACAGILRRAEKRGKQLPRQLAHALKAVEGSEQTSIAMGDV